MNFFDYAFENIHIVFSCFVPAGTGEHIHNNRPSHGLAVNTDGEKLYHFSSGKSLRVKANDVIYLPEASCYTVEDVVPGGCFAINFLIDENVTFSPFVHHLKNHSKGIELFAGTEKAFKAKGVGYTMKCKANLYSILNLLVYENELKYAPSEKEQTIAPAIEYIHNNYSEKTLNITELSKMCGIKESYFRRIFTAVHGVPPVKYINNLRLSRAKEILAQSSYNIDDVAYMSGFNNPYHFCRLFKKETDLTPSEYRKSTLIK